MHSRLNKTDIGEAAKLRPLLLHAHRAAGRNPVGFSLHPFPPVFRPSLAGCAIEETLRAHRLLVLRYNLEDGRVVKLAATADSKSAEGNFVSVRVRPRPPSHLIQLGLEEFLVDVLDSEGLFDTAADILANHELRQLVSIDQHDAFAQEVCRLSRRW